MRATPMRRFRGHLLAAMMASASLLGPSHAEEPAPGPTRPQDRRVEIINDTGVAMTSLYATNIGVDGWGKDHLGDRTLDAHQRTTLDFNDGSGACWFDLKAVFDDGDVVVRRNFNVCKETGWRLFERGPGGAAPGEAAPGEAGQRV